MIRLMARYADGLLHTSTDVVSQYSGESVPFLVSQYSGEPAPFLGISWNPGTKLSSVAPGKGNVTRVPFQELIIRYRVLWDDNVAKQHDSPTASTTERNRKSMRLFSVKVCCEGTFVKETSTG